MEVPVGKNEVPYEETDAKYAERIRETNVQWRRAIKRINIAIWFAIGAALGATVLPSPCVNRLVTDTAGNASQEIDKTAQKINRTAKLEEIFRLEYDDPAFFGTDFVPVRVGTEVVKKYEGKKYRFLIKEGGLVEVTEEDGTITTFNLNPFPLDLD
jgi:hypothetical protein